MADEAVQDYGTEIIIEPGDDFQFDMTVETSPGVFESQRMKYLRIKRLGPAITIDVIPVGDGTTIIDSDWGITTGAIHPVVTGKDIGIIASKLIKTIYGKDFTIGELPADTGSLYLAHPDRFNATDYALFQSSAGNTFLNAVANMNFTVADINHLRIINGIINLAPSSGQVVEIGNGIGASTGAKIYNKGDGSTSATINMDLVTSAEIVLLRLTDDGRLGLGITSMTAVIEIKAGTASEGQLRLRVGAALTGTDRKAGTIQHVSATQLFFYPIDNADPINLIMDAIVPGAICLNAERDLLPTTDASWAVGGASSFAPLEVDPDNNFLLTRSFDDTTPEGVGFKITIPAGATNIIFGFHSRGALAGGGTVNLDLYTFEIEEDTNVWSAKTDLTALTMPATKHYVKDTETFTLAALSLLVDKSYMIEIVRDGTGTLVGDWHLEMMSVSFS